MKVLVFVVIAAFVSKANALVEPEVAEFKDTGDVCDDCKVLFQDIKDFIQSDVSKNTSSTAAVGYVCGSVETPALYQFCAAIIRSVVPVALNGFAEMIEPVDTCISLLLCAPPTPPTNGLDQDLKFHVHPMASAIMKKDFAQLERVSAYSVKRLVLSVL